MQITYSLPHVFHPGASQVENAQVLKILLDTLINFNTAYLKNHTALPLYQSGVIYGRTQIWEPIPALYARGYGDCKSLSAALIAEYRKRGIACKPVFRFIENARQPGSINYHILVQTENGFEDPSKVLGMGKNENAHFHR